MTAAQQAALEALAGRALTPAEQTSIEALLPVRDDVQIAATLSVGRVRVVSKVIGIGTILAALAPSGGDFLNALEAASAADSNVKWVLKLIERSNFDVGHPVTRLQLQDFAIRAPAMAPGIAALLTVAEEADPIHYNTVSDALNIAEGRLTL